MAGIILQLAVVKSHNSLGPGERYHDTLRRIYRKHSVQWAQRVAIKAMNHTMYPEGRVPSLLVFGVLPRFPPFSIELPNHEERMRAFQAVRAETKSITSDLRLWRALSARLTAASTTNLKIGQEVFVYREESQPLKWTGPHKIVKIDDKQVLIDQNGETVQHSIVHVKHFTGTN